MKKAEKLERTASSVLGQLISQEFLGLRDWKFEVCTVSPSRQKKRGSMAFLSPLGVNYELKEATIYLVLRRVFFENDGFEYLVQVLRHELLHILTDLGDDNPDFISECFSRGIPASDDALRTLHRANLRPSFSFGEL